MYWYPSVHVIRHTLLLFLQVVAHTLNVLPKQRSSRRIQTIKFNFVNCARGVKHLLFRWLKFVPRSSSFTTACVSLNLSALISESTLSQLTSVVSPNSIGVSPGKIKIWELTPKYQKWVGYAADALLQNLAVEKENWSDSGNMRYQNQAGQTTLIKSSNPRSRGEQSDERHK